eukprot:TRINITY_DN1716_c0_g1_i12.p3 TRINITY_DN1716_c0_g1~~TRINITY_DN1716_c0_g1_i12.p3  ORF type:complete len:181 (-),score=7.97 TRINITY_DN1716_c0_g1_i12:538-1080(-)
MANAFQNSYIIMIDRMNITGQTPHDINGDGREKESVHVAVQLTIYFLAAICVLLTLYYCVHTARQVNQSEEQKKYEKIMKELKKLNKRKSPKLAKFLSLGLDCPICLEQIQENCKRCTLPCGHFYHLDCIQNWVQKSFPDGMPSCPVCKKSLEPLCEGYRDDQTSQQLQDWNQLHVFYFL